MNTVPGSKSSETASWIGRPVPDGPAQRLRLRVKNDTTPWDIPPPVFPSLPETDHLSPTLPTRPLPPPTPPPPPPPRAPRRR